MMATMDGMAKWLGQHAEVGEIFFYRTIFGFIPVLVLFFIENTDGPRFNFSRYILTLQLLRGVTTALLIVSIFWALQGLPFADVVGISLIGPILVIPLGAIFLGERVSRRRLALVLLSAFGAVLIIRPEIERINFYAILAFVSGFCFAITVVITKLLTNRTTYFDISFWTSTVGLLIALVWMHFLGWPISEGLQLGLFLTMGLLGGISNIMFLVAYRYAEVSFLAPFDYMIYIWSLTFGFVVFYEVPSLVSLAGALITIACGVYAAMGAESAKRAR
jgi:drug/metabolite transporter (DMT)-like permease